MLHGKIQAEKRVMRLGIGKKVNDMADQEQLAQLQEGKINWNKWRRQNPKKRIDLSGAMLMGADLEEANLHDANLSGANLHGANLNNANFERANLRGINLQGANLRRANLRAADLRGANLEEANLEEAKLSNAKPSGAILSKANLSNAKLSGVILTGSNLQGANLLGANLQAAILTRADFRRANLSDTNFRGADLQGANLHGADLRRADLSGQDLSNKDLREANLSGANLSKTLLLGTNFTNAILTDCIIYGIAAWNVQLDGAIQKNLIITQEHEAIITIDNLKVAQFIYLMLNNAEIRDIIDTLVTKTVLILGRFTPERRVILNALKEEIRKHNYTPVVFDFEKPASRDLTETVSILAHLARFIIVDLTDPSSAPHEMATVIPHTVVPVQPLLFQKPLMSDGQAMERHEYALFEDLRRRYHWVLPTFRYQDSTQLLTSLQERVITPAEQKVKELTGFEKRTASWGTHTMDL